MGFGFASADWDRDCWWGIVEGWEVGVLRSVGWCWLMGQSLGVDGRCWNELWCGEWLWRCLMMFICGESSLFELRGTCLCVWKAMEITVVWELAVMTRM